MQWSVMVFETFKGYQLFKSVCISFISSQHLPWFWKKKCFFTPKKYFFWNVDFLIAPWKNVTVMRVGGITYQPGIMYFWLGYFINRYNSFIYLFYGVFSLHHLFWFPKFENQATLVPKGKLSRTNTWFFNSLWPIWLITNQILQITKT